MTTIKNRQAGRAWQERYDAKAPRAGYMAPDFELRDVDGANAHRLSDYRGRKPVALVFGSFT
jgi:hypothetical protein